MPDPLQAPAQFDVVVIGGGPVGLVAAIGLARAGAKTALLAPRRPYGDNRTTALLAQSIELLETYGVWQRCVSSASALHVMRLIDDTDRLIRAPEVRFSCEEIGCNAFGYNIENRALLAALEQRVSEFSELTWLDDEAVAIEPHDAGVDIHTPRNGLLSARLLVGADGRHSPSRTAAGIEMKRRRLNQTAVTFNVSHTRPHSNISSEFHTSHGPCVLVPLPGQRSSVVWVTTPHEAERLMGLSDSDLSRAVEKRAHSILGQMKVEHDRNIFPLAIEQPDRFAAKRIVLVGESAHVLPPIGAQGLNMGLRDAAVISDLVADSRSDGEDDPGSSNVISRFERKRRADIGSRSLAIDIANRSLLSDFLPVQTLRALGLHLIGAYGPLRRLAMREGLSPSWQKAPTSHSPFPGLDQANATRNSQATP